MASSGQGKQPPLSLLVSSPKSEVLSHDVFSYSASHSSPALQTVPSNHLFDPETSPPSSPCPEPSSYTPRPPEASPAPAKVFLEETVSAVSRPRKNRHRPSSSSSSSEHEDDLSPCRPSQKRLRHTTQQGEAKKPDPSKSRETATSSACRDAYRAAIRGVGSAQSRRLVPSLPRGSEEVPAPKTALIPEEEYLTGEWLEVDTPLTRSSRPSSTSASDCDRCPARPRTRARQSRPTSLDGWCARAKAGDGSLTAEPSENPSVPRTSGPNKENCAAGQPLVGPQAVFSVGQVWVETAGLTVPSLSVLPASFWSSPLPSGFEFKFRITFSSSLSHTGKAHALPTPSPFRLSRSSALG